MIHKNLFSLVLFSMLLIISACSTVRPMVNANPYQIKPDNVNWLSLTGKVTAISPMAIRVDFDDQFMIVTMQSWSNRTSFLKEKQKITVYARINDLFFQARQVEADRIYIHDQDIYLTPDYHNVRKDFWYTAAADIPEGIWLGISGEAKVKADDAEHQQFILGVKNYDVVVDTSDIPDNPLDNIGYQKIERGQQLYVYGQLNNKKDRQEVKAHTIVSLINNRFK